MNELPQLIIGTYTGKKVVKKLIEITSRPDYANKTIALNGKGVEISTEIKESMKCVLNIVEIEQDEGLPFATLLEKEFAETDFDKVERSFRRKMFSLIETGNHISIKEVKPDQIPADVGVEPEQLLP
jgi:hypothetical protein